MPLLDFAVLAHECAPWVAPSTLSALVKTESDFNPYAIGVNGPLKLVRQPKTKAEAVITAQQLVTQGYHIDLGLGQISPANRRKYNLSVSDAFEPCKNLAVAATILDKDYQAAKSTGQGEQDALRLALSAYNTGSFSAGVTNGYVGTVVNQGVSRGKASNDT